MGLDTYCGGEHEVLDLGSICRIPESSRNAIVLYRPIEVVCVLWTVIMEFRGFGMFTVDHSRQVCQARHGVDHELAAVPINSCRSEQTSSSDIACRWRSRVLFPPWDCNPGWPSGEGLRELGSPE